MRTLAALGMFLLLATLVTTLNARGQARIGSVDRGDRGPTLAQVVRQTGATEYPELAGSPPDTADGRFYVLIGVLIDRDDTTSLVKLGSGYWAFRTTDSTREHVVGLRLGTRSPWWASGWTCGC